MIDEELVYINPKNLHLYSNVEEMEEYFWMERNFPRLHLGKTLIAEVEKI